MIEVYGVFIVECVDIKGIYICDLIKICSNIEIAKHFISNDIKNRKISFNYHQDMSFQNNYTHIGTREEMHNTALGGGDDFGGYIIEKFIVI